MPTSGSTDFSLTATQIIDEMLELLRVIPLGTVSVPAEYYSTCLRSLNLMFKAWQADGIYLWTEQEATVFLVEGQTSYKLGGTSPDRAVSDYVSTEISADEASGQTVLSIDSSSGMTIADVIGVELDDGTIHWTTIAAIPTSASVTLTVALTDDASENNNVYSYTSTDQIGRPTEISSVRVNLDNGNDTRVWPIAKRQYYNIPNKLAEGQPIQYYVDKQIDHTRLFVYPTSSTVENVLKVSYKRLIEDLDSSIDNVDFPQEWLAAIVYNGCIAVAPKFGKAQAISEAVAGGPSISNIAANLYKIIKNTTQEYTSIKIRPWVPRN